MKIGLIAAALAAACVPARAAGPWTLSTADTRLVLEAGDAGVRVITLADARGRHQWAGPDCVMPLPAHVWAGPDRQPIRWRFTGARRDAAAGSLVLAYRSDMPRLELRSIWRARPGRGPVEHRIDLVNRGAATVTIPQIESLALPALQTGGAAALHWVRRGGSNASTEGGAYADPLTPATDLTLESNSDDGASPVPWLAVQVGASYGLSVGWEFSGLGRIRAAGRGPGALSIAVGNRPDFRTDIGAGETFRVPGAFVGCIAGDIDEGSYALHRFVVEKLRPAPPPGVPDPILAYNLYLDAGGNQAREADVLRSARTCRELGFEAFMPDAMWFPATGDWRWDPARFPSGIGPIERYVHGSGMKLALWCAWTNGGDAAHPQALSVRGPVARPQWFNWEPAPDWKPGPFYGAVICLGCDEARAWAERKTQWLVANHRLDYLKHDCGPIVNQCSQTTHRHRYGVDASYWATMGYYTVQDRLRARFPRLLLENCSGGGHIKDYGVVQRTHYTVTTDTLSNLPDRQSIYDSTFALPPMVLQAYTYDNAYPVRGDNPGPFLWRSAMMSAWQIDPTDTLRWTAEERGTAIRAARTYREWVRPMLRDVKVHHILPRPDGAHWDGMFYWCERLRRGTLYVFRPAAREDRMTVRLKGLAARRTYLVWSEDGSAPPALRTGASLMGGGIQLRLPAEYTSDLVYVQDAALPRPRGIVPPGAFRLRAPRVVTQPFDISASLAWTPAAHARTYRVVVSHGARVVAALESGACAARVRGLPASTHLSWRVEAVSWGGRRWNAGGSGTFATPARQAARGVVFVSDMPWALATAGAGNTPRRDANYHGNRIRVGGAEMPKGVWTHAFPDATPADVTVDIAGRRFAVFAARAGVEDASGGGSVQFQVLVDGVLRAESPVMRSGGAHTFRVPAPGAARVTLRVLNGGDGFACDHAAWGMARFVMDGEKDPFGGR